MKKILPATILLLTFFCIVFSSTAQTHGNYYAMFNNEVSPAFEKVKLPANRAEFIFLNSNSKYTNPAVAVLNTKNSFSGIKDTEINTTIASAELVENKTLQKSICMFPNLTEDELWVKIDSQPSAVENLNVEVYNEEGERVYNSRLENNLHKINLCDFTAGTFLVKLGDSVQKIEIE